MPTEAYALGARWKFGGPEFNRVSPDGKQLLMKLGFSTSSGEGTGEGSSIVTCSLGYVVGTIKPIVPGDCQEVHRWETSARWQEIVAWGALKGTIYTTHTSYVDPTNNSLYRVTLPTVTAPRLVEELFHNGGILMGARATLAPLEASVANGEIVAVYERASLEGTQGSPGGTRCSKVTVIDAYSCTALDCPILNQKGMRSITWLPDGRLAGRGQTPPKKGNGSCLQDATFVAYPAIDSNNTASPTVLTTSPTVEWGSIEGSGGGW